MDVGSIQHCFLAYGDILMTPGGSTPILRHRTNATDDVLIFSFKDHLDTRLIFCDFDSCSLCCCC